MQKLNRLLITAAAMGLLGTCADVSHAALARLTGGAYSGTLSRNKAIRKQQLIVDPAGTGGPLSMGAPRRGSTSINYDPTIVTVAGLELGQGYGGSGVVEGRGSGGNPPLPGNKKFLPAPHPGGNRPAQGVFY